MNSNIFSMWVYLAESPLFWLTLTLLVYVAADAFSVYLKRHPLANPVLHAVWITGAFLLATGTPYEMYFAGAQFIHFLLGPATVALALPLYEYRKIVIKAALPMLVALTAGSVTALISVRVLALLFNVPPDVLPSLLPKSVTSGIAMGVAESLGGNASLAAAMVIVTGIIGAIIGTPLYNILQIKDWRARGFAMGVTAHGIGTARALQVHPLAGTFSGIGMGLNGLLTAILAPILWSMLK